MAKKTERDIERAKAEMEVAHQKKMEAIDRVAERAKSAETAMHEKKVRMLDEAATRAAAAAAATAAKANRLTKNVSKKAEEVATTVTMKVSDAGEAVGAEAGMLSERAGEIRTKTGQRLQRQPWIVGIAAAALLLALGISIGRRYFSPA